MNIRIKSQQRWIRLAQEQEASGLSVEAFCVRENVCRTSFYASRKRLGMAKGREAALSILKERTSKGFMRIMPPANKLTAIRIKTPNGYKVDTGYDSVDGLKDVLQVLQAL